MKISVCLTVLNEEKSIASLLQSLLDQTQKPDEIIVVDGGSSDKTVQIIRHFQKKDQRIKLVVEKSGIAKGRNLAINLAKNDIVALTDAGCEPYRDWLENLTYFLRHKEVDIVAGFYEMPSSTLLGKVISCYLGVPEERFNAASFLPSTRSVAFRKDVWEKLGGFNENLKKTGEDTLFFYNAVKNNVKIARAEKARVVWKEPGQLTLRVFFKKATDYAYGDAKSKIFWHPAKGLMSHNIKAMSIFLRYFVFICAFFFFLSGVNLYLLPILFIFYLFWPILKWKDVIPSKGLIYLPLVQVISDFGVMKGFIRGLLKD